MKTLLISYIILICNPSFGKSRDYSTTRLLSTSGTGVGAILFNESSVLNPASIAFFDNSAIYYQNSTTQLENENLSRTDGYDDGQEEALIISDTSSALKGTFSFFQRKENNIRNKRYASSIATPLSDRSSFGFLFSYSDTLQVEPNKRLTSNFKTSLGYTFVYNKKVSLGLIYTDIAREDKFDQLIIGGFQFEVSDSFHILADAGFNPNFSVEKYSLHRLGLQMNVFAGLFIRLGQYFDNSTSLKGRSWGASWVGPKLAVDYAYRESSPIDESASFFYKDETLIEHSLALSVRF